MATTDFIQLILFYTKDHFLAVSRCYFIVNYFQL